MKSQSVILASASAEQSRAIAARLSEECRGILRTETCTSVFIGLKGDLGAGKTTFVQGFVHALAEGRSLYVTSPTFAIAQEYETSPRVTHMDLYRLGSLDELETIGYRDFYFRDGVTLVEWVERVPEAVPERRIEITFEVEASSDVRRVQISGFGEPFESLVRRTWS